MSVTTKPTAGATPATNTHSDAMAGLKDGVAQATRAAEPQQPATPGSVEAVRTAATRILSFHQENLSAVMQSGQSLADGLQEIVRQLAANARTTMDNGFHTLQAMTGATSLKDAMELQTGFVRASCERVAGQVNELAETSRRVGEQAAAPLSARVTAAADAFLLQH